jgi:hypothetical protein
MVTEQMMERMLAEMKTGQKEMKAEIRISPEEMKSIAEQQDAPKEEAAV